MPVIDFCHSRFRMIQHFGNCQSGNTQTRHVASCCSTKIVWNEPDLGMCLKPQR
jgi:hypothetical protein